MRAAKAAQTKATATAKEFNRNLAKVDPNASLLGDDYKQKLEDYAAVKDFGDADFSERPSEITGFSPNTGDNADAESVARGSEIFQRFATAEEANRGYLASPDQETTTEATNKPSSSENGVSKPSQQVSDTAASVAEASAPKKIDYTNAPVMGPIYEPNNEGRGAEVGQKQPTYESSMAEFKEKFGDGGSLRPEKGETGDQFQARLKERAALKRQIASLRPEEPEKNIIEKGLDFVRNLGKNFQQRQQEQSAANSQTSTPEGAGLGRPNSTSTKMPADWKGPPQTRMGELPPRDDIEGTVRRNTSGRSSRPRRLQTGGLGQKRLIAPEYIRTQKAAKRLAKQGYKQEAGRMAARAEEQRLMTPAIRSQEYRQGESARQEQVAQAAAQRQAMTQQFLEMMRPSTVDYGAQRPTFQATKYY